MPLWENIRYFPYLKYKKVIREHFSFLIDEYEFKEISAEMDVWGVRVIFCNLTTGVRVAYQPREGGFNIRLMRLVNGKIHDNPLTIDDDSVLNQYNLEMLLSIREPNYTKNQIERYSEKQEDLDALKEIVTDLRNRAQDILLGDFTIFHELEKIVKENARAFR